MARVAQSDDELRPHLQEQIGFLRESCVRFDEGKTAYAKQASLNLRVLLHDTGASRSLLGVLGLKTQIRFLDTAGQMLESNLATSANLVTMRLTIVDESVNVDQAPIRRQGASAKGIASSSARSIQRASKLNAASASMASASR